MAKAPSKNCIDIAIEASGGLINGKEAIAAFDNANKIKQNILEGPFKTNLDKRVAAEIGRLAGDAKLTALVNKQTYMRNVIVFRDMLAHVDEMKAHGIDEAKAITTFFHGSIGDKGPRRVSVESTRHGYEAELLGTINGRIMAAGKEHIFKLMDDKNFDNAVAHELHAPDSTGNSDAAFLAAIYAERLEWSRVKRNSLGAYIQKAAGYAGPQIDNDVKMRKAGQEAWVTRTRELLDLKKTFPHLDPQSDSAEIDKILGDSYNSIVSGSTKSATQVNFGIEATVKNFNIATAASKHRTKHFSSAENSIAYQNEFGAGSTTSTILETLKSDARDMSLMEKLGNNPSATLDRVLLELEKNMIARGASKDELNTIKSGALKDVLDIATGESAFVANHTVAKVAGEIRAASTMGLLGHSVLGAMPTDTVNIATASMLRGGGFADTILKTIFSRAEGLTREERLEHVYLHGEGFDGINGALARTALADDGRIGFMSKHLDTYFKFNGLGPWTEWARGMATRVITAQVGYNAGKDFGQLNWKFQNVLAQNGIDAANWNAIRHATVQLSNGRTYSSPSAFHKIPEETITPLIAEDLANTNAQLISKHTKGGKFDQEGFDKDWTNRRRQLIEGKREALKLQYLGYVSDEVNFSVVETSDADRVMQSRWGLGRPKGTMAGEAARFILQFSSFPLSFAHKVLGRAMFGTDSKIANAGHVGGLMAGMLIAGYVSNVMNDAFKGVTPEVPSQDNWKDVFYKAAAKSGFAGFYGDALLGALFTSAGPTAVMGPEVDNLWKSMKSVGDLLSGKYQKSAGEIVDVAMNHVPYGNLFYLRPVLDMAFLNELDSYVHPKRQEQRQQRLDKSGQSRMFSDNLWKQ